MSRKLKKKLVILILALLVMSSVSFGAFAWSWSSVISLHLPRWGGIAYDTNVGKSPDVASTSASFILTEGGQVLKPLSAIIRKDREVISEWTKMNLNDITYSPIKYLAFAPSLTYCSAARSSNAEPNSVTIKYKFIPQDVRE